MTVLSVTSIIAAAIIVTPDFLAALPKQTGRDVPRARWLPPYFSAPPLSIDDAYSGMKAAISAFISTALQ